MIADRFDHGAAGLKRLPSAKVSVVRSGAAGTAEPASEVDEEGYCSTGSRRWPPYRQAGRGDLLVARATFLSAYGHNNVFG
ncbi:hypothetical protein EFV37_31695 [Mesorhizobium loti]|uniref:Uncharacterized protein n=2 Tax=Mesorhizobium TaxID=68287 RepID=A0A1A5HZ70_RHILI|nr:hypothetical protein [Mesorhizobium loti]QKC66311.1 hypothetical protein EB229_31685 [Mesorhizobium jarvisii]QKC79126.1 hypothetical protein EB233_29550 [Mesorhizobium erdmanii]ANN60713.1 hypothetical protein A9174_31070 [Mesorhizobium loti NZP2037]OBP72269.1 hypothetical protein BAE42_15715 [Mesorhizobium loti]OBP78003.1 hypothetical protein BAE39_30670 [Mesorhizobium loti]